MILTTPLFYELKRLFPHWEISVICTSENEKIIKYSSVISNIYIYPKNIIKRIQLIKKIKNEKFDIWIDTKPEFSNTSRLLLKYCHPKKSFGYNLIEKIFQVDLTRFKKENHYTDINLSIFKYFDSTYDPALHRMPVIEIPVAMENNGINLPDRKFIIAINVSAGKESRIWQKEKWLELIDRISKISDCYFILIGVSKHKFILDYILSGYKNSNIIKIIDEDILKISDIIRKSNLLITPDTALVHIASAFNIPQIVMYPNVRWNYERFAPLSNIHERIFSKDEKNISDIEVNEVLDRFKKISGNAESRTRVQTDDH